MSPYEPREDSFLIQKHIKEFCNKDSIVLDMGTGSGILAFEAAKYCKHVTAVDIDFEVINDLKKKYVVKCKNKAIVPKKSTTYRSSKARSSSKITFLQSNLFSKLNKIKNKLDLIIFNPPYIPTKKNEAKYIDLDGGKNGTEVIEPFLKNAKLYLKPTGKVLLLTSSLNKHIKTLFDKYHYTYRLLDKEKFAFEELQVWVLE